MPGENIVTGMGNAGRQPRGEIALSRRAGNRSMLHHAYSRGILGALAEHRERIRSPGVRRIGVFGSFARGEEREESDIDILIEFEEGGRSFDTYMGLKFFLEDLFGRRVDLVDRDAIKPALAPHILWSVRYLPEAPHSISSLPGDRSPR